MFSRGLMGTGYFSCRSMFCNGRAKQRQKSCLSPFPAPLLRVDHDTSAAKLSRRIRIVPISHLIVVDDARSPDLDSELVHSSPARHLAVDRSQNKIVVPSAIDRTRALVLSARPTDHQPFVVQAVEVQVRDVNRNSVYSGFPLSTLRHNPHCVATSDRHSAVSFTVQYR